MAIRPGPREALRWRVGEKAPLLQARGSGWRASGASVAAASVLLAGLAGPLAAQPAAAGRQPAITEPPVRYDTDLLAPEFHRGRRAALLESLPANAVAVILSTPRRNRENDVDFEYRQDSYLYYLTGTHEPSSVLVLAPGGIEVDDEQVTELLMVPPRDPASEMWTGRLFGADRAEARLGVEKAVTIERFEEILGPLLESRRLYHLPLPDGLASGSQLDRQVAFLVEKGKVLRLQGRFVRFALPRMLSVSTDEELRRTRALLRRLSDRFGAEALGGPATREIFDAFLAAGSASDWRAWKKEHIEGRYADGSLLRSRLDALRAVKTDEELALLRRAIDITVEAHREAMRSIEPGMHEYEVEALVEYIFRRNGAEHPGFPSIIGSGENSVILHYETNRRRMEAADMVVIDIGAEYHGYSADVTRTVPVDGVFSPEQRSIYELVLRAQEKALGAARAGRSFNAPHAAARKVLLEGMRELGLVSKEEELGRFFMHGTSHYVGLYVHDVGSYGKLEPGNVITVEPGIYIAAAPDIDPKWWNIGVRIEDDVLVTEGDPVVLSASAPRTVAEIEALMREKGLGNAAAGKVE
ncbi:MAG: aminopeptidase P N-terminal domain-containing protein [Gemmatimonadota bacterium]